MKITLKGCPKCGGDVETPATKRDDPSCIQCGFELNENSVQRVLRQKNERLKLVVVNE